MQQVEKTAPDQKSIVAARRLARPGPWSDTGSTDVLVWGKCQGSGSSAYQVTVDLTGPAFKCTCPSRKFPCKHGLALLLLWVEGNGAVADAAEPAGFAGEWKAERDRRSAGAGAGAARTRRPETGEPADPEAKARRREQRLAAMAAGCDDFELWLTDLVRNGMAAAREQGYDYWDTAASRLVDAQLPGLAERVRDMGGRIHATERWADLLLGEVGRWFTAVRAWRRLDRLDPDDAANVRTFLGWPVPTEDVLAGPHHTDRWIVLGVHRTESGRLQQQRTWLRGADTSTDALILDFASVGGALRVAQVVGTIIDTPLAHYHGSGVQRSLFAEDPNPAGRISALPAGTTIDGALIDRAMRLAENPWVDRVPCILEDLAIEPSPTGAVAVDAQGHSLPLVADVPAEQWLAVTGGHPLRLFGELEDDQFRPLTLDTGTDLLAP